MSPLKLGPGSGSSRLLGPGTSERCRTHRVPLGPVQRMGPGEEAAALRLSQEAAARLKEEGLPLPRVRPATDRQARCPECVQGFALAAVARLQGDD